MKIKKSWIQGLNEEAEKRYIDPLNGKKLRKLHTAKWPRERSVKYSKDFSDCYTTCCLTILECYD